MAAFWLVGCAVALSYAMGAHSALQALVRHRPRHEEFPRTEHGDVLASAACAHDGSAGRFRVQEPGKQAFAQGGACPLPRSFGNRLRFALLLGILPGNPRTSRPDRLRNFPRRDA